MDSSDPHHLLRGVDNLPKGTSRKNEDRWAIPLCLAHHNNRLLGYTGDYLHNHGNDEEWLTSIGIDGRQLAEALWACRLRDNYEDACHRVVMRAKQQVSA